MKIALGADDTYPILKPLYALLCQAGHVVSCFGALGVEGPNASPTASITACPTASTSPLSWPQVGLAVGEAVAKGDCGMGIVLCWSGTGVCMAANKRPLAKPRILVSGQEKINEEPECTKSVHEDSDLIFDEPRGQKTMVSQVV